MLKPEAVPEMKASHKWDWILVDVASRVFLATTTWHLPATPVVAPTFSNVIPSITKVIYRL